MKRLKEEKAVVLLLVVLDVAAFLMTGAFEEGNHLGANIGLAIFLVIGALIFVDAIRVGLAIKYKHYVWYVVALGIIPIFGVLVGLFVLVQLSNAVNTINEYQRLQAGSFGLAPGSVPLAKMPVTMERTLEAESPVEPT